MEWIDSLRAFVTSVEQGSLSAAGRLLGTSPAAISRRISGLEDRIDAQLLKRSSRSLALTDAGALYFEHVSALLQNLDEANESVRLLQSSPKGALRVHSRMLVGENFVVPSLPSFLERYPEIQIELSMSNGEAQVMSGGFDVDIRIGLLANSSLLFRKLVSTQRIICAAPSYLSSRSAIRGPMDLAEHNCLTYRVNMGPNIWRFMDPQQQVTEVHVNGNFRTDFGQSLLLLARAGVGISMLPEWSVRADLESGALVQLLQSYSVTHIAFEDGVYAVFPHSRRTSAKLRVFLDFLAEASRHGLNNA